MFLYYLLSGFAIRGSLVKSNKYLFAGIACVQSHDLFYGIVLDILQDKRVVNQNWKFRLFKHCQVKHHKAAETRTCSAIIRTIVYVPCWL